MLISCTSSSEGESNWWLPSELVSVSEVIFWKKQPPPSLKRLKANFLLNNCYEDKLFAYKIFNHKCYRATPAHGVLHPNDPICVSLTVDANVAMKKKKDEIFIYFLQVTCSDINWRTFWRKNIENPETENYRLTVWYLNDRRGQEFFESMPFRSNSGRNSFTSSESKTIGLKSIPSKSAIAGGSRDSQEKCERNRISLDSSSTKCKDKSTFLKRTKSCQTNKKSVVFYIDGNSSASCTSVKENQKKLKRSCSEQTKAPCKPQVVSILSKTCHEKTDLNNRISRKNKRLRRQKKCDLLQPIPCESEETERDNTSECKTNLKIAESCTESGDSNDEGAVTIKVKLEEPHSCSSLTSESDRHSQSSNVNSRNLENSESCSSYARPKKQCDQNGIYKRKQNQEFKNLESCSSNASTFRPKQKCDNGIFSKKKQTKKSNSPVTKNTNNGESDSSCTKSDEDDTCSTSKSNDCAQDTWSDFQLKLLHKLSDCSTTSNNPAVNLYQKKRGSEFKSTTNEKNKRFGSNKTKKTPNCTENVSHSPHMESWRSIGDTLKYRILFEEPFEPVTLLKLEHLHEMNNNCSYEEAILRKSVSSKHSILPSSSQSTTYARSNFTLASESDRDINPRTDCSEVELYGSSSCSTTASYFQNKISSDKNLWFKNSLNLAFSDMPSTKSTEVKFPDTIYKDTCCTTREPFRPAAFTPVSKPLRLSSRTYFAEISSPVDYCYQEHRPDMTKKTKSCGCGLSNKPNPKKSKDFCGCNKLVRSNSYSRILVQPFDVFMRGLSKKKQEKLKKSLSEGSIKKAHVPEQKQRHLTVSSNRHTLIKQAQRECPPEATEDKINDRRQLSKQPCQTCNQEEESSVDPPIYYRFL